MKRHIQLYGLTTFLFFAMMGLLLMLTGCAAERQREKIINPSAKWRCHETSGETTLCEKYYDPQEH